MAQAAPEEMTRDELEQRVRELETRIDELETDTQKNNLKPGRLGINILIQSLTGEEIDDFQAEPLEHKDALQEFNARFERLEKTVYKLEDMAQEEESLSSDPNVENWQAIVQTAQNLSGHRDHVTQGNFVKLYKKQIASAVGCSERHAQDLIEDYGADPDEHDKGKRGTDWQKHKHIKSSRKTEGSNVRKKALLVDMDVWGEDA